MSFSVGAGEYDRFMGKYSTPLAPLFADLAGVEPGQRALDVGCGPGALTAELVRRLGPDHVSAVDPSASFVSAAREHHPEVNVRRASAEDLPFDVGAFDAALAQLVVHFMADPVAGLREMARVTRAGGVVAACVWDHSGDRGPLSLFWQAAHDLDPEVEGESQLTGAREGDLRKTMQAAGLHQIEERVLSVGVESPTFEDWWEPFTFGVGPAGGYVAGLDRTARERLREHCRELLPAPPFTIGALAWAARGIA